MVTLTPLWPDRALLDEDTCTLIIGDVHLGFEIALSEQGIHVPVQDERLLVSLNDLLARTSAHRLVINGDLVDPLFRKWRVERRLHRFIEGIACEDIHLLPGNHDARVRDVLPEGVALHPSDGAVFDGVAACHGHRFPSREVVAHRVLTLSHTHPAVLLTPGGDDDVSPMKEVCWLTHCGPARVLFVLPPFNPYMGGSPVNVPMRRTSVLFSRGEADIEACDVHLLDGLRLGRVGDLLVGRPPRG